MPRQLQIVVTEYKFNIKQLLDGQLMVIKFTTQNQYWGWRVWLKINHENFWKEQLELKYKWNTYL